MAGANELFMNAYRSFENAVKTAGYDSVLGYEDHLEKNAADTGKKDPDLSRIKLCRQCRNFIAHEDADFFYADKRMTAFLQDLAGKLSKKELPVKKYMNRNMIYESTKLRDAVVLILKHKRSCVAVPVFNKAGNVVGVISMTSVYEFLSENNVTTRTDVKSVMGTSKNDIDGFMPIDENMPVGDLSIGPNAYVVMNAKDVPIGWF